jgi:hypothetical protein
MSAAKRSDRKFTAPSTWKSADANISNSHDSVPATFKSDETESDSLKMNSPETEKVDWAVPEPRRLMELPNRARCLIEAHESTMKVPPETLESPERLETPLFESPPPARQVSDTESFPDMIPVFASETA